MSDAVERKRDFETIVRPDVSNKPPAKRERETLFVVERLIVFRLIERAESRERVAIELFLNLGDEGRRGLFEIFVLDLLDERGNAFDEIGAFAIFALVETAHTANRL